MHQNIPKKISFLLLFFISGLAYLFTTQTPAFSQTYTCSWVQGEHLCYFNPAYNQNCPEGYEPPNCSQFTNTTYEDCQMDSHDCVLLPTQTPTSTIGPTPIPTEGPGQSCELAQTTGADGQPVCRIPNHSLCPHDPTICCHNDHMDNCPGPKHESCILNPNEPGPCPSSHPVMCAGTGYCCTAEDACQAGPIGSFLSPFCNGDDGINTAIGCIPISDGNAFVEWLFPHLLGIMGGIAFLLMLYGGFLILTASGNPEKIQAGQETITSAIAGLVFAIFSLFILQLIGVEILSIPGLQ